MPKGDYEVRERLARTELVEGADLHRPEVFTPYFREVYKNVSTAPKVKIHTGEKSFGEKPFQEAHAQLYFGQVADAYQMIEGEMVPVIIRGYDEQKVSRPARHHPVIAEIKKNAARRGAPYKATPSTFIRIRRSGSSTCSATFPS